MKSNNKGLSLVEVIVVVAIMGILVGLLSPAISLLFSKDARKSAEIIQGELDKVRSYTISKQGDWSLKIEKNGSKFEIQILDATTVVETTSLPEYITVDPGSIEITFLASSGAVSKVNNNNPDAITEIKVTSSRDPSEVVTVSLVQLTGRHYIGE